MPSGVSMQRATFSPKDKVAKNKRPQVASDKTGLL
jgi:hypothetical protein